ncbi:MauE/DoxX family redox-associated membrane protein [Psychroserpens mesophilus]|uniref:MauE/DoxX family redox-associated membrane protein n=1 Tax=Psychroserpens mesophilus TaxID=325473 RepID=UPI003D655815
MKTLKNTFQNLKKDKLFWVRLCAFFAFLIPLIMSPRIWFSERLFPLVSFFEGIPVPNFTFDVVLIALFVISFLGFVFKPSWKFSAFVIGIYVFWVLLDQNRIQPFYFEIIFMVLALTQFNDNPKRVKQCVLLILVGTYFWSGMHKWNALFFEKWAFGLSKRIPFVPEWMRLIFTYAVPFLEALFGVFLIFSKTRKIGIWSITLMHAIIIITFVTGGYGYIVFPMTLFNVFVLFYLFYKSSFSLKDLCVLKHPQSIALFLIAIVFPVFNLLGFYDHILAFSYFSGKPKYCKIHFNNLKDIDTLPEHIKLNVKHEAEDYYIDLNEWSGSTIGVIVYPEERVYKKIKNYLDTYLEVPNTYLEYY